MTDVAELLPNHIQIPIEVNNLCSTFDSKLSANLGMYIFGLLQNMKILIMLKISVSFSYFLAHVTTMCK